VSGILLFFGIPIKPLIYFLYAGNLASYFLVLLPLSNIVTSIILLELAVVLCETVIIKYISTLEIDQEQFFSSLKWRYALLVSAIGNMSSYWVGEDLLA